MGKSQELSDSSWCAFFWLDRLEVQLRLGSGLMSCGRCGVSAISISSRLVEVRRHPGVWSFGLTRSQSSPGERSTGEKGRVRVVLVLAMN